MSKRIQEELLRNMDKNEIFYSLSKVDVYYTEKQLLENQSSPFLNIIIKLNQEDLDMMFKLLSTTYKLPNKSQLELDIWENYLANKILLEISKQTIIYTSQDLEKECKLLRSFNIEEYLKFYPNRTTIQTVNHIIKNQISKKVRIHYFTLDSIIPLALQEVIGKTFMMTLNFSNMLYTSQNSICCNYKVSGDWIIEDEGYQEVWKSYSNLQGNQFIWN